MSTTDRLANAAWEALYRAQATITLELTNADVWGDLSPREYSVLYALSTAADGLRITELGDDALITQPGMSRLVARLEARGLVDRADDPADARACRIHLTATGTAAQRRVGAALARRVTGAMTRALDEPQLEVLRGLGQALLAAAERDARHPARPEPKRREA